MDTQRRRPSSIAEQAMRKLVLNNHSQQPQPQPVSAPPQPQQQQQQQTQLSESPVSPRHAAAAAIATSSVTVPPLTLPSLTTDCSLTIDLNTSPLPSPQGVIVSGVTPILTTLTLRDTNIREQAPLPPLLRESSYFRGSTLTNSGINSSTFLSRERDCSSPFIANAAQYGSLIGTRENSCLLSRDNSCSPMVITHRTPSSRFLTSGIDQRIIKQSTEDCRRLLQQVKIYIKSK